MSFEFPDSIICPWDGTATPGRIAQYRKYYKVKHDIVKSINPKVIVEIGVRAGYSAFAFMSACPDATYVGYDADNQKHGGQGSKPYVPWAEKILNEAGFENRMHWPVDTQKIDVLPEGGDFYHIDGDHSTAGVMHDLDLCFAQLFEGGFMLIDDYDYIGGVTKGVDQWLQDHDELVEREYIKSLRGEMLIWKKAE